MHQYWIMMNWRTLNSRDGPSLRKAKAVTCHFFWDFLPTVEWGKLMQRMIDIAIFDVLLVALALVWETNQFTMSTEDGQTKTCISTWIQEPRVVVYFKSNISSQVNGMKTEKCPQWTDLWGSKWGTILLLGELAFVWNETERRIRTQRGSEHSNPSWVTILTTRPWRNISMTSL